MSLQKDINFLYEIGQLRYIKRMWSRFLGPDFANLAEHHYRVIWIAIILASYEKDVDTTKIIKLALVHDIAESRTGDADYLARQYISRNEELGISDMLKNTSLEAEFKSLWAEYDNLSSQEAKIVKDADNLDIDFELAEIASKGNVLKQIWSEQRDYVRDNQLYTKTARQMAAALAKSDPHEWHLTGRTRRLAGDWKDKS